MAGGTAPPAELLQALADDEFDPDEYDRQMAAAYGEDFYEVRRGPAGRGWGRMTRHPMGEGVGRSCWGCIDASPWS